MFEGGRPRGCTCVLGGTASYPIHYSASSDVLRDKFALQGEQAVAFHVPPAPQPPRLLPESYGGLGAAPVGSGGGWVWAAAILIAARLGRVTAQEARLDVRQMQVGLRLWLPP
jgi:hypothetical protein